jgi:hypothetical protein
MMSQVTEPQVVLAKVDDLRQSPDNPRRINDRDFDRLRRSVRDDPDFMRLRPVLARPDGSVYAGNMRLEAARAEGWTEVPVIYTDDPEAVIKARAVKDNASYGEWVEEDLAEYLGTLGELNPDIELDTLGLDDAMSQLIGIDAGDIHVDQSPLVPNVAGDVGGDTRAGYEDGDPAADVIPNQRAEASLYTLQMLPFLGDDAIGRFDFPRLREDRFVEELPEPLTTWAGADAKQDDPFYLYNYSPNGTWRDVPLDRCILSFFTDDRFLLRWWDNPAYYVARARASGVTMAVEPDISPVARPRIVGLFNVYRARYCARFMQDADIRIIPRLVYPPAPDHPEAGYLDDVSLVGWPDHVPIVAYNAQSDRNEDPDLQARGLTHFWRETGKTCGTLLVYGAKGWATMEPHVDLPMRVVVLPSFLAQRAALGLPWRAN